MADRSLGRAGNNTYDYNFDRYALFGIHRFFGTMEIFLAGEEGGDKLIIEMYYNEYSFYY